MTRPRQTAAPSGPGHQEIIDAYREALSAPARFPWEGCGWEPVRIGPTWQTTPDGHWLLPERSIGWHVLGWCGTALQHDFLGPDDRPVPWRFTLEQARFILHWYAVDDAGRWLWSDFVLQRLKGWGKDPLGGCLMMTEAFGPCRFAGEWGPDGQPRATDEPSAWVQTAAVAQQQTKNTMRLLPSLVSKATQAELGIDIGKTMVHGLDDTRLIEAVTSSPATLEGARATFLLRNETQHWLENNEGHEMAAVTHRNAAKSKGGRARSGSITNAFEPGDDSVAEQDRYAYEQVEAGLAEPVGLLYDSLEAAADAPLTKEAAPAVLRSVAGDSDWLDIDSMVRQILDVRNPASRSRRYWYNQVGATEDAWITPQQYDARVVLEADVLPGSIITLGLDPSESDDHTALVACSVELDHCWPLGMWRPDQGTGRIDTADVDRVVRQAFADYDVVGFFADSHPLEELIDAWAEDFGDTLCVKAHAKHAVAWSIDRRLQQYTLAVQRLYAAIAKGPVTFGPDRWMRQHFIAARRYANQWGIAVRKEHRESAKKIDAVPATVLARLARFEYLALPASRQRQPEKPRRGGRVW